MDLADIVQDFATCLKRVDARAPQHIPFQPGIGPHPEETTVELVTEELAVV